MLEELAEFGQGESIGKAMDILDVRRYAWHKLSTWACH
jgi:hypothetical protein